jgi:hypothetical protein
MKRLFNIQQALKCGKESYNQFGKFKYRTTSAILEAVKPLLKQQGLLLLMTDEIKAVGSREILIAEVAIYDAESNELVCSSNGCAEIGQYNGMSIGQATGSSSTYARKYALCGLFAIDDSTDDPDVKNNTLSGMIESATCASDINLLMSQVKGASEEDKKLFNKKVKELKLTFNKDTKKYEQQ